LTSELNVVKGELSGKEEVSAKVERQLRAKLAQIDEASTQK